MVEHVLSMYNALGFIHSIKKRKKGAGDIEQW
jgi:hypothetical protein